MLRVIKYFSLRSYAAAASAANTTASASDSSKLRFTFASPDKALYTNQVIKQVDVPTLAGYVGVLANHVPTIGVLKPGVVQIHEEDGNSSKFFVSSGTLSVNIDGSVQVLAEEVLKVDEIDESLARKELEEGQRKLTEASSEIEKAEASIRVEVADALIKTATGQH